MTGVFYYQSRLARCRADAQEKIAAIADLKVDEVSLWRKERLADANLLYKNAAFSMLVRRCFEQPNDLPLQEELQSWMSRIQTNSQYSRIVLHNAANGQWTWFTDAKIPLSSKTIEQVLLAEQTKQLIFADFSPNDYSGKVYLRLFIPILDDQAEERALGTLLLRIDPNVYLYPLIQRWPTPSRSGEFLLVRREGNEAVFLNELRFQKNTALVLHHPLTEPATPAVKAVLGKTGNCEGKDYRGVPVLAALRAIPNSPWFLVAKIDAEEVYAPMQERFWLTILFVCVVLSIAGLAVGIAWRQQQGQFYQERSETAETLRKVNANLAITLKSIGDAVISTDLAGKVIQMNPVAESLTGWKSADAAGHALREVFHIINAKTREPSQDPVTQVLETGQILGLANHTLLIHRDGTERQIADSASPIRDAEGRIRGVVLVFRDVTEAYAAAETLRASEERFRSFVENASDVVFALTPDGVFSYISPNWKERAENATLEILGKPFEYFVHPDDASMCREYLARVLRTGERLVSVDYRILRPDGLLRWHSTKASALRDKDGKIIGCLGIARDVTEQKLAQEALRETNEYLEKLFNYANAPIIVWDPQFKITRFNHAFESLTGRTAEEVVGRPLEILFPPALIESSMKRIVETQQGDRWETVEIPIHHVDGSVRTVLWNSAPIFGPDGKTLAATIAQGLDITIRKQALEALRVSEETFRKHVENSFDVIFTLDENGTFLFISPAWERHFGYPVRDALGKPFTPFVHPDDVAPLVLYLARVLETEQSETSPSYRVKRSDGSWRWFITNGTSYIDTQGKKQFIGVGHDITERKLAEDALQESERSYRLLAENIHDVIWAMDIYGRFTYFSPYAEHMFGRKWDKNIKVTFKDVAAPSALLLAHQIVRNVAIAVRNGERLKISQEMEMQRVDNSTFWAEVNFGGLYDESGRMVGFSGVTRDITERKKVEQALQESEQKLREAQEMVHLGYWKWDVQTGAVEWSDEVYKIFQRDPKLFIPNINSILELSPWPEDRERDKELLRRAMETHEKGTYEQKFLRPDDSVGYYHSTFQGKYDEDGNLIDIIGTILDITERKESERRERLFTKILEILNSDLELADAIHNILGVIHELTGFDAVGIRLQSGDDFPYFSQTGFSDDFLLTENTLTVNSEDGRRCLDLEGHPLLECTCGLVLSGRTDPASPYFTANGSFWVNNSIPLLNIPPDKDPRLHPRNRCIHEGFCSVALIPIRVKQKIVGLLQLNDRKKNCFTPEMIQFFEGIGASIGVALARKQAVEALRESERFAHSTLDALTSHLAILDETGEIIAVNRAWREFAKANPPILKNVCEEANYLSVCEEAVGPDAEEAEAVADHIRAIMRNEETEFSTEYSCHSPEQKRWFIVRITRFPGEGAVRLVVEHQNITVRKLAEETIRHSKEELEQYTAALEVVNKDLEESRHVAEAATRVKSQFLATMSHEIRTPLNAIIGMTGLLLDTTLNAEQRDCSETIRVSSEILLALINDILDFSKIEAGRMELENHPFDAMQCIEEALDLVSPGAMEKGIEMVYKMDGEMPRCFIGDAARVRQILVNLLSNAVKFTEKGEIIVSLSGEPLDNDRYQLNFTVQDTGLGIPYDRRERLFQAFSQIDASTSRRFGGTGLGLAISNRLSELMGGRMWAESTGVPGEGTTFHFTIQVVKAAEQDLPGKQDLESAAILIGKKILLVDDNTISLSILVSQTTRWAMFPTTAASGQEALDTILAGNRFDLAILDMQMPEMDGVMLASELKSIPGVETMPLILLSSIAHHMTPSENALFAVRLTKPAKAAQLRTVLCTVLGTEMEPEMMSEADKTPNELQNGESQEVAKQRLRILLAEDNPINQKVALKMLGKLGYRADVVANGLEVLQSLKHVAYDVILMDCQMPEMDGYEATRQIRMREQEEGGPRVHIIAMTAHAMQGDREQCLAADMDDYLGKPVRTMELQQALERVHPITHAMPHNGRPAH
jgi:PAS domain S-box-containing protein